MEAFYTERGHGRDSLLPLHLLLASPFSVLATRYQCHSLDAALPLPAAEGSVWGSLRRVAREEGLRGFFRGWLPFWAGAGVMRFFSGSYSTGVLFMLSSTRESERGYFISTTAVGVVLYSAFELLRVAAVLGFVHRDSPNTAFSSYTALLSATWRLYGVPGLFCGLAPCALRLGALNAAWGDAGVLRQDPARPSLAFSRLLVLVGAVYPLDVLQKRMLARLLLGERASAWAVARQLIEREGLRGLYRGFVPYCLALALVSLPSWPRPAQDH